MSIKEQSLSDLRVIKKLSALDVYLDGNSKFPI